MEKRFALIVEYTCGDCVFLTDTNDLTEALKQFREAQAAIFSGALHDKSFQLPPVISARITRLFYQ